jgi:glycolate oxidase FAD binding subunit
MTALAWSGPGGARPGTNDDAIDGAVPGTVVVPANAGELAAALAEASRLRATTVVCGGRTKIEWGRPASNIDLALSTARLDGIVTHSHGDLIATLEAGATIEAVNAVLARHGQWLPIDATFAGATIGGVLATNDSGPLRHRHGTPRDQLIGIRLATIDGRVVKAGGEVVKNVAGYDLGKLVTGSHGALAAIVGATFKLAPIPRASKTVVARARDRRVAATLVSSIAAGRSEPLAMEVVSNSDAAPVDVLVRFASTSAAVDAQVDALRAEARASSIEIDVLGGDAEDTLWRAHGQRVWTDDGVVVRCAWPPAALEAVLGRLSSIADDTHTVMTLTARAGVGAGHVRIAGDAAAQVRAVAQLRAATPSIRHVVVLRAPLAVKSQIDVWGDLGDAAIVLQALKRALDPAGILGAGRGPL